MLAKPPALVDKYRNNAHIAFYQRRGTKFGTAVFVGDEQKLYPLDLLNDTPVMDDIIAGQPELIVLHTPSQTARAFDPLLNGKSIQFELSEVTEYDVQPRECSSGSILSGPTGRH